MDFDRSMITSRNEQMSREVYSLRLQERLRVTRDGGGLASQGCQPDRDLYQDSTLGPAP
jgi:hypothetical protein